MALSVQDVKILQAKINMAEKKKEELFTKSASHYHKLYAGEDAPLSSTISTKELININMSRPNIEIQKPVVFLQNPKIFITNKKKNIDTGKKDPTTKIPIVLDGNKTASTIEDACNSLVWEISLKQEMAKCRDDNLIGSFSVIMTGYNTDFGIDDDENEFIRSEDIFVQHIDPSMFGVDPELNEFDLSKAKFCYRIVVSELNDVKDNPAYKNTKDLNGSDFDFGSISDSGKMKSLVDYSNYPEYTSTDDAKRVVLYEIWKKPTQAEKRKGEKGKVIVLAKDYEKVLREDDWPLRIDGYPFEICTFNQMNDRFYPPFDLSFYEAQLLEKNKLRTYQLDQAKIAGNFKVIVDSEFFGDEENEKLTEGDNLVIPIKNLQGNDIRSKIMVVTPGSVSAEYYTVDQKIDRDTEIISLLPETKKGVRSAKNQSATEVSLESQASDTQPAMRLDIMTDFYIRVVRKMIQLMKQFYDKKKMIEVTGREDIEWTDSGFSDISIKNEYDVKIDVSTMIPKNEAVERRQALDIADRLLRIVESPQAMAKLIHEGTNINLTEALVEVSKKFGITNNKILETIDSNTQMDYLKFIQAIMTKGSSAGSSPMAQSTTPTIASENSAAQNAVPGSQGALPEPSPLGV
jgi:hypothetical protein